MQACVSIGNYGKKTQRSNVCFVLLPRRGRPAGLGPGVGYDLLGLAIVELLCDRKGLVGGPTPALAAGLLQRRQIEQARRRRCSTDTASGPVCPAAALAMASATARSRMGP